MGNEVLEALQTLLKAVQVGEILTEQNIVTMSSTNTLMEVVETLRSHKIQSCPIISPTNQFQGFLELGDIVNYLVAGAENPEEANTSAIVALSEGGPPVSKILGTFRKFGKPVESSSSLLHVTEVFRDSRVHHAVVMDKVWDYRVTHILSQSDIARYLANHIPPSVGELNLRDVHCCRSEVFTVRSTSTVLVALQKLALVNVGALAVVDSDGRLIANFSTSDLSGLLREDTGLGNTVEQFLEMTSPKSHYPIFALPDRSLQENIALLSENHVHHIWIVDSAHKPQGVFSVTDVVDLVLGHTEETPALI